ncbi:MAG: extracellular solute-binding protein [Ilumatobacteraceae bacterium]
MQPSPPHRRRRVALAAITVAALAAVATGCSGDDGDTLHVYSGRHYGIESAFEAYMEETGVKIEFLTGNDAELRERIAAEGDDTKADAYITVDAGNLAAAAEQGLFQPTDSPILDAAIPDELSDPDGLWYGLTQRVRTIVFNPDEIDRADVPTTYEQLADPEWKGRICLRNSSNVYQQSLVASLIASDGEEEALRVVEGWADNAEILNNDVLILESLADGLCDVGIVNHYYLARMIEEDPDFPVELLWANQDDRGVHVNISGGGVTAASKHPEMAQAFLEWLATDGQQALVGGNHEYPANPDTPVDPLIVEEFGTDFLRDPLDASVFGALNPEATRLMDEAGYR